MFNGVDVGQNEHCADISLTLEKCEGISHYFQNFSQTLQWISPMKIVQTIHWTQRTEDLLPRDAGKTGSTEATFCIWIHHLTSLNSEDLSFILLLHYYISASGVSGRLWMQSQDNKRYKDTKDPDWHQQHQLFSCLVIIRVWSYLNTHLKQSQHLTLTSRLNQTYFVYLVNEKRHIWIFCNLCKLLTNKSTLCQGFIGYCIFHGTGLWNYALNI